MKLNIKSIKRTRLGRLWLAEFVRLIWESLAPYQRACLLPTWGPRSSILSAHERRVMIDLGLVTPALRRLTDLGAEVASHGRRHGRGRRRKS